MKKVTLLILFVFIFSVSSKCFAADANISILTYSSDYEKTRAILFSKGYSVKIEGPKKKIDSLNPTDRVIVIDDNQKWEMNALIKLYKHAQSGGKSVYIFSKRTGFVPSINDILGSKYKFMLVSENFNFKKKSYQGNELCRLWDGLIVGPDCRRELFINYMIPADKSLVKASTKKGGKQVATALELPVGSGKIMFLCMPYFDDDNCGHFPVMFADAGIEKFENVEALTRLCDWLLAK